MLKFNELKSFREKLLGRPIQINGRIDVQKMRIVKEIDASQHTLSDVADPNACFDSLFDSPTPIKQASTNLAQTTKADLQKSVETETDKNEVFDSIFPF